jgi:hypothetical protein
MNHRTRFSLFVGAILFLCCWCENVYAINIELENDGIINTTQFPTANPIFISGTSGLTFTSETSSLLSISVSAQATSPSGFTVFLGDLNLKLYDPSTGTVITTLVLKDDARVRFMASGTSIRSAVFTVSDFAGSVPENQTLALAVFSRMSCNCAAFASIVVSTVPVPEPAAIILLPTGLAALLLRFRIARSRL